MTVCTSRAFVCISFFFILSSPFFHFSSPASSPATGEEGDQNRDSVSAKEKKDRLREEQRQKRKAVSLFVAWQLVSCKDIIVELRTIWESGYNLSKMHVFNAA